MWEAETGGPRPAGEQGREQTTAATHRQEEHIFHPIWFHLGGFTLVYMHSWATFPEM